MENRLAHSSAPAKERGGGVDAYSWTRGSAGPLMGLGSSADPAGARFRKALVAAGALVLLVGWFVDPVRALPNLLLGAFLLLSLGLGGLFYWFIGSMDGIHVPTILPTGTFAYSASKAAVHHLTRTLAVELAPQQITVNAVAPGFFESKMTAQVLAEHRKAIEDACPLHRIGKPEEMAGIAIYLASRAGAYTNGAVIPVYGKA